MKKYLLLFIVLMAAVPVMSQSYKFALVKDEGGITNIRKGPGTNYPVVSTVQDGFFVHCIPTTKAWTKVYTSYTSDDPQDFIGYISTSKLVYPKRQGAWKQIGQVKQEGGYTNIRRGPGTSYAIVDKVKDGTFILWSGDYGDKWFRVYTQQGAFRGYISSSKIDFFESPTF